jgi:hypothetical protein
MRLLLSSALLVMAALTSTDARSFSAAPIMVTVDVPKPVRMRVSSGPALPCDSSTNVPLFEGTVTPRSQFSIANDAVCACWQHTDPAFPDNGWSAPQVTCRPRHCRGRRCFAEMDRPIYITVR